MTKLESLKPVIGPKPKVLILGSMPGKQSLVKQQYYGNPRNHFWPIMSRLLNKDLTVFSYEDKIEYLKKHGIALWDVIATCEREGSLDSAIRHEKSNDIKTLLEHESSIAWIGLNGTKAYQSFEKYIKHAAFKPVPYKKLPSTSPVPGRNVKSFSEKVEIWGEMAAYLT